MTASAVTYAFDRIPEPAEAFAVAPGVNWLRMPLQLTGLSHINLWLLEDSDGWTVVDTGMNSEPIRDLWDQVFATHLAGKPVTRVICTHFHPDHMGLAGWITERWGCRLWATRTEWLFGRMLYLDAQPTPPAFFIDHYRKVGFKAEVLDEIAKRSYANYASSVSPIPEQYRRIVDGETVRIGAHDWQVICGYGHAPEHACLYCAELGVMISGDQILPKITPHIGVYPAEPDANPLQEYIDSLDIFRPLPNGILVLPAHNEPFRNLHGRLDYLARHHADRLAALEAMLGEPKRVMSTLKVLFGRMMRPHETFLAVGEAIAHLNCLIAQGRAVRELDAEGVWTYRRAGEKTAAA
jgi:glyoxylase-like metal-dependent hydrolase (beta-lactamase superfamily II)